MMTVKHVLDLRKLEIHVDKIILAMPHNYLWQYEFVIADGEIEVTRDGGPGECVLTIRGHDLVMSQQNSEETA